SYVLIAGFGKSSANNPNPGMIAVHPQSSCLKSTISTSSVSPGLASFTYTGPETGFTFSKLIFATSFSVDCFVNCPSDDSLISYDTVSPDDFSVNAERELSQPYCLCVL